MNELKELKAQAYDLIAAVEHYQKLLQEVNLKIQEVQKNELDKKDEEKS